MLLAKNKNEHANFNVNKQKLIHERFNEVFHITELSS